MTNATAAMEMGLSNTEGTTRRIWGAYQSKKDAEDVARMLRDQGRKTRVYQRQVRAEALSILVWVVVTDVLA